MLRPQSHTHTPDVTRWDSGERSHRHLLPSSLLLTPPLTRTFYFSTYFSPRFVSGSHERRPAPYLKGSSCLHHRFSRWPFLLLVFTRLSALAAAALSQAPISAHAHLHSAPHPHSHSHPRPRPRRGSGRTAGGLCHLVAVRGKKPTRCSRYKLKSPLS